MMRAALDTNVLVSAAIKKYGKPARILALSGERFTLLCSDYILSEVMTVLTRRHLRKWLPDASFRERFAAELKDSAEIVSTATPVRAARDPKDNPILACALDGKADVVVTGDGDLLELGSFQDIQIVTPALFLAMLESW